MTHYKTQLPWGFLLSDSRDSLQGYELSRLSHAANLRKEIGALLDKWMEENSSAMLARWLMEQRERPRLVMKPPPTVSRHGKILLSCPILFFRTKPFRRPRTAVEHDVLVSF